jgi:hypothetical protein
MVVNKEIGMKLKALRAEIECDWYYEKDELKRKRAFGASNDCEFTVSEAKEFCDAPEKGDVFAWFRGKGIIGAIHVLSKNYSFLIFTNDKDDGFTGKDFDTWEQAEDACIEEMIKLIQ